MVTTSIIIPTLRKRPESLKRLLDSIKLHTKDYEILFAEGGDC
jgi:glycosyltransferase involved in cell wall biosynthesis